MLEVTFAYVVATAILLSFKSTRSMGAVAVFILLCVSPVLASALLILAAVGYHYFAKRRNRVVPKRLPWGD